MVSRTNDDPSQVLSRKHTAQNICHIIFGMDLYIIFKTDKIYYNNIKKCFVKHS